MRVYAISDLHLSFQVDKPMDVFGDNWAGYEEKIFKSWSENVGADDVGIIAGDISWAMRMSETEKDFEYLSKLSGTKIIVRGNHDYWWSSISKVREALPEGVIALQNDSVRIGNAVFAGTRGWKLPERRQFLKTEDKKILDREIIRFEMSLKDAQKKMQDGDTLLAILHYPPFNSMRDQSAFTDLCEQYGVKVCVYGHLHGKGGRAQMELERNGVVYHLTSCDLLNHEVKEIVY